MSGEWSLKIQWMFKYSLKRTPGTPNQIRFGNGSGPDSIYGTTERGRHEILLIRCAVRKHAHSGVVKVHGKKVQSHTAGRLLRGLTVI